MPVDIGKWRAPFNAAHARIRTDQPRLVAAIAAQGNIAAIERQAWLQLQLRVESATELERFHREQEFRTRDEAGQLTGIVEGLAEWVDKSDRAGLKDEVGSAEIGEALKSGGRHVPVIKALLAGEDAKALAKRKIQASELSAEEKAARLREIEQDPRKALELLDSMDLDRDEQQELQRIHRDTKLFDQLGSDAYDSASEIKQLLTDRVQAAGDAQAETGEKVAKVVGTLELRGLQEVLLNGQIGSTDGSAPVVFDAGNFGPMNANHV